MSGEAEVLTFRQLTVDDGPEAVELFRAAVIAQGAKGYSDQQAEQWSRAMTLERWADRCQQCRVEAAVQGDRIAGYAAMDEEDGHITLCYVHPDFFGQGIGAILLRRAAERAVELGLSRLYLESSLNANGFYLKQGFVSLGEEEIPNSGMTYTVIHMERHLTPVI